MDNIDSLVEKILSSETDDENSIATDLEFLDNFFLDEEFESSFETTSPTDIKNFLDDLECIDVIEKNILEQFENSSSSINVAEEIKKVMEVESPPSPIIQIMTKRGALTVNPIEGYDRSLLKSKIDNKDKKIMKLIDSLKVKLHDKRRQYMSDFFSYHNTYDFPSMKKFFHQNSIGDDLQGHFEIIDTNVEVILPKKIYIRGIDTILSFIQSFLRAVPDFIVFTSDTVIRNKLKSSIITTKMASHGTRVYRVVLNNSPDSAIVSKKSNYNNNSNNNNNNNNINNSFSESSSFTLLDNRKRKNEIVNSTIPSDRSINITDLCDKIEKIDLSDNISVSQPCDDNSNGDSEINLVRSRKNSVNFQCGPMLPKQFKLETSGTATFHLNEDHKIYLYEYKVTHKKTFL